MGWRFCTPSDSLATVQLDSLVMGLAQIWAYRFQHNSHCHRVNLGSVPTLGSFQPLFQLNMHSHLLLPDIRVYTYNVGKLQSGALQAG